MNKKRVQSLPDAVRVMEGLRHVSYTPETALADLIDNSIAAGATKVGVRINEKFDGSYQVIIADNGCGMDQKTLEAAMQYGSSKSLARTSLSVYGLGMKMASTSFSRVFTVVTRENGKEAFAATYNLDDQVNDPWTFEIGSATVMQTKTIEFVSGTGPGTAVIWEKADFKLEDRSRGKKKAPKNHKELEGKIRQYLAMVFHRYMDGSINDRNPVEISLNDDILVAWNPVDDDYLDDTWTPIIDSWNQVVTVNGDEIEIPYSITTYKLKSKDDEEIYPGAFDDSRMGMKTQGIFAYRANRILQMPDWLDTLSFHPDTNAMRVCLELDPRLDEIIRTDVKKSGIWLPDEMYQNIKDALETYKAELKRRNNEKKAKKAKAKPVDHLGSSALIDRNLDGIPLLHVVSTDGDLLTLQTPFGQSTTLVKPDLHDNNSTQRIQSVDDLEGGMLWEPRMNGADQVIYLNKSHPFYAKIYLACRELPIAVNGLDILLYSLANAEMMTRTDRAKEQFTQMRMLMSMTLRTLVDELEYAKDENFDDPEV